LGIQIGEVAGFKLDQENQVVMVEFKIGEGIKVYEDAIASIKTSGLIGDRYVSLDAGGSGLILKPGGVITQTESPPDLSDLIGKYAFGDVGKEGKEKK
jgi:phospholipid/cholesterol/gamma-HCH transport system substrate-binding protein